MLCFLLELIYFEAGPALMDKSEEGKNQRKNIVYLFWASHLHHYVVSVYLPLCVHALVCVILKEAWLRRDFLILECLAPEAPLWRACDASW